MRSQLAAGLDEFRVRHGSWGSHFGRSGMFLIPGPCNAVLTVIASDGAGWPFDPPVWEHVSVSTRSRTPNWREMEFVREIWFLPSETVVQFSVPRADHINLHPFCLHMWRPVGVDLPRPPAGTVG